MAVRTYLDRPAGRPKADSMNEELVLPGHQVLPGRAPILGGGALAESRTIDEGLDSAEYCRGGDDRIAVVVNSDV
jgi:hypothetical protein